MAAIEDRIVLVEHISVVVTEFVEKLLGHVISLD
jgi:hypothetical protein